MIHSVCGSPIIVTRVRLPGEPPIDEMQLHCAWCKRLVPPTELEPHRVSPGRSWELDDEDGA